jgi:hypothetical protein
LSFLFAPAAGAAPLPPSADGEFLCWGSAKKLSARQGRTRLRQFACPGQPVQKRSRPERMNRVRSLCTPAQPVLRKRQLLSGKKERQKKTSAFLYKNTLDIL